MYMLADFPLGCWQALVSGVFSLFGRRDVRQGNVFKGRHWSTVAESAWYFLSDPCIFEPSGDNIKSELSIVIS